MEPRYVRVDAAMIQPLFDPMKQLRRSLVADEVSEIKRNADVIELSNVGR